MPCLEVLEAALRQAPVAERVAFVDARGDLLIQACNLVLSAINADDEQRQAEQKQLDLCSTEVCRANALWIVIHCTALPGQGEL